MAEEFEDQLRARFQDARQELPADEFTHAFMVRLAKSRRREQVRFLTGAAAALVLISLLLPDLARLLMGAASHSQAALDATARFLGDVARSPLFLVYAGAFGAYLLFRLLAKLRLRLL